MPRTFGDDTAVSGLGPSGAGPAVGRGPQASERGLVLVVVADDDRRSTISETLRAAGYDVVETDGPDAALRCLGERRIEVIVFAHQQGVRDVADIMDHDAALGVPVVVLSAHGDEAEAVRLMKRGVAEYLVDSRDAVDALPVVVRHVSQEARLAAHARGAELRYRTLFENSGDAIFIHDMNGRLLDANDSACRLLGHGRTELLALSLADITRPRGGIVAGDDEPLSGLWQLGEDGRLSFEAEMVCAGGATLPVEIVSTRKTLGDESLLFSIARNLSERVRHGEALARATAEWEQTFNAITDPLVLADVDGRIVRANHAMHERLGLSADELRGQSAIELLRPGADPLADDGRRFREPTTWEADLPQLGGQFQVTTFPGRDEGGAIGNVLLYCKDVTHERQLRARMLQTEKLSSLGQLVSGVAHELNNPLAAVQGLAELLLEDLQETGSGDIEDVRNILEQSQRASGIVRNLLQFSRRSHHKGELFDLNAAARAAVGLLRYRLSSHEIELDLALESNLPAVFGVIQQVEQVIVNLLMNAYEALTEREQGGRIRVATRAAGDVIELVVEDDGPGVPGENASRLFEPFFTTKEVGRGTGLGLSVSYGIVQEHGGDIHLDTDHEVGARFVVRLPVSGRTRGVPAVIDSPSPDFDGDLGDERILLVDDEPEWADAMREALTQRDLDTTAVTSAAEAVRRLSEGRWDLVICDAEMVVPDADERFHDLLVRRFPSLQDRVTLTVRDGADLPGGLDTAWPVLRKPFSTDRLFEWTIRNLRRIRQRS